MNFIETLLGALRAQALQGPNVPGATPPFVPNYPVPQQPQQAPFFQRLRGGFNNFADRLTGPADPNLSAQQNAMRAQMMRRAMAAQLLQSSAPRPQGTGNAFGDLGAAILAGQEAGSQFSNDALRNETIRRSLAEADRHAQSVAAFQAYVRSLGGPNGPQLTKQQADYISSVAGVDPSAAARMIGGLLEPAPGPELSRKRAEGAGS